MDKAKREQVARALAKALAFQECGQQGKAEKWARELVRLLECADILVESSTDEGERRYREHCQQQGFPWCDTCGKPAVWQEGAGFRHSTSQHPCGVPNHLDDSGHEVTATEWYNTPLDEL